MHVCCVFCLACGLASDAEPADATQCSASWRKATAIDAPTVCDGTSQEGAGDGRLQRRRAEKQFAGVDVLVLQFLFFRGKNREQIDVFLPPYTYLKS